MISVYKYLYFPLTYFGSLCTPFQPPIFSYNTCFFYQLLVRVCFLSVNFPNAYYLFLTYNIDPFSFSIDTAKNYIKISLDSVFICCKFSIYRVLQQKERVAKKISQITLFENRNFCLFVCQMEHRVLSCKKHTLF